MGKKSNKNENSNSWVEGCENMETLFEFRFLTVGWATNLTEQKDSDGETKGYFFNFNFQ